MSLQSISWVEASQQSTISGTDQHTVQHASRGVQWLRPLAAKVRRLTQRVLQLVAAPDCATLLVAVPVGASYEHANGSRPVPATLLDAIRLRNQAGPSDHWRPQITATSESSVQQQVRARLDAAGHGPLRRVGCRIEGEQIVLHGHVPSYRLKQLAQICAQRAGGGRQVSNELEVQGGHN